MSEQQKIFTGRYVDQLYSAVKNGESIKDYSSEEIDIDPVNTYTTPIVIPATVPDLGVKPSDDVDSAIAVFEHLGPLSASQASDPRLWTYLSHVTFREYTMNRWKLDSSDESKKKSSIIDHWFVSENDRRLRRHSIARLWWAAKLTVSPWESDPTNFISLKKEDKYVYTRTLLSTQDIFLNVLERSMGRSRKILIALLEAFRANSDLAENREAVRSLIKEVNLVLGYRKLTFLPYTEIQQIFSGIVAEKG